jgi:type III secretory pathway lipoprotein EscJ
MAAYYQLQDQEKSIIRISDDICYVGISPNESYHLRMKWTNDSRDISVEFRYEKKEQLANDLRNIKELIHNRFTCIEPDNFGGLQ